MPDIVLIKLLEVGGALTIFLFFMWRVHSTSQKQLIILIEILSRMQSTHYQYIFDVLKQQNKIIDASLDLLHTKSTDERPALSNVEVPVSNTEEHDQNNINESEEA